MTPPLETRRLAKRGRRTNPRLRGLGQIALVGTAAVAMLWLVNGVAFDGPTFVERVTIDNASEFDLHVDVRSAGDDSRLGLGVAVEHCRTAFELVADQGATWVFHFRSQDRDGGEVTIARADLAGSGWTLQVPAEVVDQLRQSRTPAPPDRRCG